MSTRADEKQYHDVFVTVDKRGEGLREGEKAITHKQAHRAVSMRSAKGDRADSLDPA